MSVETFKTDYIVFIIMLLKSHWPIFCQY